MIDLVMGGTFIRLARGGLFSVMVSLTISVSGFAWGQRGHQMANAAAINSLPQPLRSYFHTRKLFFIEHAADPDGLASEKASERPHHYTDVEAYDSFPFSTFHKQFVEERRGPSTLQLQHGDSLWQIELFTQRMAQALRHARWGEADHAALFAAHYACDLTQPLHTVVNYDGQLTHQQGLHARFESDLVRARGGQWELTPRPAANEPDLRARIFDEMLGSYGYRNIIFAADHIAAFNRTYTDPEYTTTFFNLTELLARKRLAAAASFVSSLWYTAWVQAGKPNLPAQPRATTGAVAVSPFRPVRPR